MNSLIEFKNEVIIDSRDIAELTGKQHAHVLRDIIEGLGYGIINISGKMK